MKKKILLSLIILPFICGLAAFTLLLYPRTDLQPLPDSLISFASPQGQNLFVNADAKSDFDELAENFKTQWLKSYCGVASAVAVLNAMDVQVTQPTFFNSDTSSVRSRWKVTFTGMTLEAFGALLQAHGAVASVRHGGSFTLDEFREIIVRNFSNDGDYFVVNYQREVLGQDRVGHISPLSA
ncbi:glutathione gamma-glutamylcysteinyltransferase [Loktanella sp. M215]|nr:glutathione gamma-glutamylcysteinyltransferase [Loktanella sp. M215]